MGENPSINLKFGWGHRVQKSFDKGVQRSAFNTTSQNCQSLFDKADKDRNKILDATELAEFYNSLNAAADGSRLSKGEARDFLKDYGMDNISRRESRGLIEEFLNVLGGDQDRVIEATRDTDNNVTVNYSGNGHLVETYRHTTNAEGKDVSVLEKSTEVAQDGSQIEKLYDSTGTTVLTTNRTREITTDDVIEDIVDLGTGVLPDGISKIKDSFTGDVMNDPITREYMDADGNTLCTRTYWYGDGTTVINQQDQNNRLTNQFTLDGNDNLTNRKDLEYLDNNTVKTTSSDGTTTLAHGNFDVEMEYDANGNVISHARAGESFDETASRLGFDKTSNPEGYAAFKAANAKASNRSHHGWFNLKENVIIPQDHLAELDVANYRVDPQAELDVYRKSGVSHEPGADNSTAIRKQKERNNAMNATNRMVEEFVNANPRPEVEEYSTTAGDNVRIISTENKAIYVGTQPDGTHYVIIRTDTANENTEGYTVNNQVEYYLNADGNSITKIWSDDNDDNSAGYNINLNNGDAAAQSLIQQILTLFGGQWPAAPTATS
ncbi:hypothetical protein J6S88_03630 [bacterium]|nr:hypothetical protein [bacterium]